MLRFLVGVVLILVSGCRQQPVAESHLTSDPDTELSLEQTNEMLDYFYEVAFSSEFGESAGRVAKWGMDVKIFVSGQSPAYLDTELDSIIQELNQLTESIQLSRTDSKADSNYLIHFGTADEYAKIEPNAKAYVDDNWGLLWVYWDANREIYQGSMYVDTLRASDQAAQKHLLREELTQSLGFLNDSYRYPESIFYQDWTKTTQYAEIDKTLIKILYNKKVRAGMTRQEFSHVVNSLKDD